MKKSQIIKIILMLLIGLSVVLPSGSVYGVNLKIILSALSVLSVFYVLLSKSISKMLVYFVLLFFVFILGWSGIAAANGVPSEQIMSHAIAVSSLFIMIFIPVFLIEKQIITQQDVLRISLVSLGVFSVFKILISFAIWGGASPAQIKSILENIFQVSFIGLDAGVFYRVHLPIDYLLPISIYFLIQNHTDYGKPTKKISYILVGLFIVAVIISYSRLLYAYSAISLALTVITAKLNRKKVVAFVMAYLAVGTYLLVSKFDVLASFLSERYSGAFADNSDATRTIMFTALLDTYQHYPAFGRGLGAGALNFINVETMPWYFELQWLSFAMQFGMIGFFIVLATAMYPVKMFLDKKPRKNYISIGILYVSWLLVGVFNGFMLTSAGGVVFLFFICLATAPLKKYQTKLLS